MDREWDSSPYKPNYTTEYESGDLADLYEDEQIEQAYIERMERRHRNVNIAIYVVIIGLIVTYSLVAWLQSLGPQ